MKIRKVPVFSIIALTLVLSACAPAASTPAMTEAMTEPAMTEAMTEPAMTEAMTEPAMTEDAMMKGADSVAVSDQKLGSDNSLVVDKVMASADGWIVIHADANGKPGAVLGHAAVKKGENDKVKVVLDDTKDLGGAVWAMLHIDAGTLGTYEFPGSDAPVKDAGGAIVMLSFKVTK
jgi:hypothetical protein